MLAKMVGEARTGANALTTDLLGHLLTEEVRADLDRLLIVDIGLGMTRLEWLWQGAREAMASAVKASIDKLLWLRAINRGFSATSEPFRRYDDGGVPGGTGRYRFRDGTRWNVMERLTV